MTRVPNWPQRLAALLLDWRDQPFQWGVRDCGTFAAAVIDACCATAYLPALVGRYATFRSALHWMRARNAPTLIEVAEVLTANARAAATGAQTGDLLWFDEPPIGRLAVRYGAYACGLTPAGLAMVDSAAARWRIPVGAV